MTNLLEGSRLALCLAWMTLSLLVFLPFLSLTRRSNALSLASRSSTCRHLLTRLLTRPCMHVHLLQGVVEGFYKHVGVDPCTLSVHSSKSFQTHTLDVCILLTILRALLPGGDSWPTPLGTWCSTSGSTHQTHVCQRLHLVESEPLIVYMDVK